MKLHLLASQLYFSLDATVQEGTPTTANLY